MDSLNARRKYRDSSVGLLLLQRRDTRGTGNLGFPVHSTERDSIFRPRMAPRRFLVYMHSAAGGILKLRDKNDDMRLLYNPVCEHV